MQLKILNYESTNISSKDQDIKNKNLEFKTIESSISKLF